MEKELEDIMDADLGVDGDSEVRHGKRANGVTTICFRGKRLEAENWKYKGSLYKGSHFPIVVYTDNTGRRSPESFARRSEKNKLWKQIHESPW